MGAIYIDQGYDAAKQFISERLFPKLDEIIEKKLWQDAKSSLQEKAQEMTGATPVYKVLSEEGPDHAREFTVGVYVRDELAGQGQGKSKQEAEQAAAREALDKKGW